MARTMSAIGTKRTLTSAPHMSAFDPKRTWSRPNSAEIDPNHFAPRWPAHYVYNSVSRIARNRNPRFGLPAEYFTGDSYGQSKEACCDTQEKL